MSHEHVRFALDQALQVSGSELLVLVSLAEWADADGRCWPSHDSIAKRARVSRRQVIRLIRSLADRGLIEITERRQYSNSYTVRCDIAVSDVTCDTHVTSEQSRCDIAMADVTFSSDVTFGAPDVTSRVSDVTSSASRCDIAMSPEPPIEPPTRTTTKNHQTGACAETPKKAEPKKPMPTNGPIQTLVSAYYDRVGGQPVSFGKAMGHGKSLVHANVTEAELMALVDWLEADPFWQDKGIDLGTCVTQLEKFRQSRRMPKTGKKSKPGLFAGFDEFERIVTANETENPFSDADNVIETDWSVR